MTATSVWMPRVRARIDPGQGGHGESRDGLQAAAGVVPAYRGPVALVPGVQQASEVLVGLGVLAAEDGVGLVHQQGGRHVGPDGPVHGHRGRVDGDQRGVAGALHDVLATQRPDAKSLPTAISASAVLRMCLKVMGQTENNMVLGTSAYKNGVRATMFAFTDKGICYFTGPDGVGQAESQTLERAANLCRTPGHPPGFACLKYEVNLRKIPGELR